MKHHISYFCNAPTASSVVRNIKFIKYREKKLTLFKMSIIGTNTSTQACWPLVNCVINQRLFQASPHMQQTLSQLINITKVTVMSHLPYKWN